MSAGGVGLPPDTWAKARASDSASGCVEVSQQAGKYRVRDTKDGGAGPVLDLSANSWTLLGELVSTAPVGRTVVNLGLGVTAVRSHDGALKLAGPAGCLSYTAHEVGCFADGLRRGEFEPVDARPPRNNGPAT